MTIPSALTCEAMVEGAWRTYGLDQAKLLPSDVLKRCPVCHGRVTIQGVYNARGYATLSHRRTHDGCSLIPRHYQGEPKRHPQALK